MKKFRMYYRFVSMYVLLARFDLGLSKRGFTETFKRYSKKYYSQETSYQISESSVVEIEEFFTLLNIVCAWYPRKADCIHKTLIGYRILHSRYSIPVEMVIGVRKFPFQAHAWLMLNNQDLLMDEESNEYKVILSSYKYVQGEQ
ncbi:MULTISPECIES: lasso peptide biosynthesis B2 protein [Bacillus]|nr:MULTISPECIES: lasso peptide biosynthesis B2 protein [Bacillus cereus group]EJR04052.1 hypothetical protein II5_03759 [Bacillus cereus MSX-A1]MBV6678951.1 lasso peptide biosynthesis B2 protein [Bacillus thuringiensis]MCH5447003.1 lasso peptide biosynthesis B2 protein [Bacillus cereus]MDR4294053.1 lasso peptide biosynthesis B2 protein [Bacillus cereus]MEC3156497.1 lasso peptide biosynthesis B2 protein [Bacillus thuringiensis]